jgi:hypothetical protein
MSFEMRWLVCNGSEKVLQYRYQIENINYDMFTSTGSPIKTTGWSIWTAVPTVDEKK